MPFSWGIRSFVLSIMFFTACGSEFYRSFDRRKEYNRALRPSANLTRTSEITGKSFDQSLYASILKDCVSRDKGIDRNRLFKKRKQLMQYLKSLAKSTPSEYQLYEWDAFMINAFNAFVLQLVLEAKTINQARDFRRTGEWEKDRFKLGESLVSLRELEEVIFETFRDTRKRLTLISGIDSNPPLREEPYVGARLPEQVLDQVVRYKSDEDRELEKAMKRFDQGKH